MKNLTTALLTLFVALKLLGYIDWSWWLVVSPLLIPVVPFLFAGGAYLVFTFIWCFKTSKKIDKRVKEKQKEEKKECKINPITNECEDEDSIDKVEPHNKD